MDYSLLLDIGLIIIIATLFSYVIKLFRQPLLLAYILAGVFVGPLGIGIISNTNEIIILSELGIAFLLFGAGVEVNFNKLKGIGFVSFVNGLMQVLLTIVIGIIASSYFGLNQTQSIYMGLIISFSSTMVVLKLLTDNHALSSLHGRLMMGILIVQDLLAIIALSFLSNIGQPLNLETVSNIVINGLGLFSIAIVANKFLFPYLLKFASKSQELLFLTSISTCFAFMGFAYGLGFSIAIGALIGGLALSAFDYDAEIAGKIRSLKDFFATIFFVSLGMQITTNINPSFLIFIGAMLFLVVVIKPVIITLLYALQGYGGRTAISTGLGLAQISEFSFIIATYGLMSGVLNSTLFSAVTIVIIITLLLTPYLFGVDKKIYLFFSETSKIFSLFKRKFFTRRLPKQWREASKKMKNHIIILGCHRMGGEIINEIRDKVLVVDYDPEVIKMLQERKIPYVYGDLFNEAVYEKLGIKNARMVVITIPDEEAAITAIERIRKENKRIPIIVRATFADEALRLYKKGADAVILPETVAGERVAHYIKLLESDKNVLRNFKARHLERIKRMMGKNNKRLGSKLTILKRGFKHG